MSKNKMSDILLQCMWGYAIIWHNETVLIEAGGSFVWTGQFSLTLGIEDN